MAIKTETKVGFFVFISILIFVIFVFAIGGHSWQGSNIYHAVFQTVSGLKEKSAVKYGGMEVGIVETIRFVDRSPVEIYEVDFKINRSIRLRGGSVASIKTSGFIGDSFLDVEPGKKDTFLKPGAKLPSRKAIGLGEIMEQAQKAVERINSAITSLMGEESGEKVSRILSNVETASADLKELMKKAHAFVDDSKPKLTATASNLESFSGELKGTVHENRKDIRATITNLKAVSASLNKSVDPILVKLDGFITDMKHISGDNKDDIRKTIVHLKQTAKNFSEFSADIRKHPWKLLSKPKKRRRK